MNISSLNIRLSLYAAILISGFMIAAAFMANNTEYKAYFWPVIVVSTIIFVLSVREVVKRF